MTSQYLEVGDFDLHPFGLDCSGDLTQRLYEYADTHTFSLEGESSAELCEHWTENLDGVMGVFFEECETFRDTEVPLFLEAILDVVGKSMSLPSSFSGQFECSYQTRFTYSNTFYDIYPTDECNGVEECVKEVKVSADVVSDSFVVIDRVVKVDATQFCEDVLEPNLVSRLECLDECNIFCNDEYIREIVGESIWTNYLACSDFVDIDSLCDLFSNQEGTRSPTIDETPETSYPTRFPTAASYSPTSEPIEAMNAPSSSPSSYPTCLPTSSPETSTDSPSSEDDETTLTPSRSPTINEENESGGTLASSSVDNSSDPSAIWLVLMSLLVLSMMTIAVFTYLGYRKK